MLRVQLGQYDLEKILAAKKQIEEFVGNLEKVVMNGNEIQLCGKVLHPEANYIIIKDGEKISLFRQVGWPTVTQDHSIVKKAKGIGLDMDGRKYHDLYANEDSKLTSSHSVRSGGDSDEDIA